MEYRFSSLFILSAITALSPMDLSGAEKIDFNRHVRPILSDNCFACHGFDAKHRKADLRLDVPEGAFAMTDGVQAIRPGDSDASALIQRILTQDEDEIMPPPDSHKKLTKDQIALLKQWVKEGATYRKHWAFEAPVKVTPPNAGNIEGGVDAFIQDRLKREGLNPVPQATKPEQIRRVTLDLTGLPPTLAEVDAFLADTSDGAYERVVDRLLHSVRYGEHMARYWLDAARYADTHGLHLDNERSMWPYRDWVVRAFNENLPFDQFTTWQLAGDLLPGATLDQQIASGFNRCNVTTSEGGSIGEEWIFRYAVDRTETTMSVWLGLTAGCAVCHDHKFDPISQKEFYQMYAFFNSAADPAMDGNILLTPPILRLATDQQKKSIADQMSALTDVQKKITAALPLDSYEDPALAKVKPPVKETDSVWFDDAFPAGAKVTAHGGGVPLFVEKPVHSGTKALKITSTGLAQDFYDSGAQPLVVPTNGKFFLHVFLDPDQPPTALMVQFNINSWSNRAIWGDESKIPFGKLNTPEKILMGPLPKVGEWVRLEVDAKKIGVKNGAQIKGFAFTLHGGTVYWDQMGVRSTVDPANDPSWSYSTWRKQSQGKRVEVLPLDLRDLVRGKKPELWSPEEARRVKTFWLENLYSGVSPEVQKMRTQRTALTAKKEELEAAVPATFIMKDMDKPRDAFVMQRGQYDKPGDRVSRQTPAVFPAMPKKADYTRLDLAQWLVSPSHPLTARVAVNRLWQQFFGVGLVKSSNDFGSQGEPPSHPELLDWLAVTFREQGWDMKKLVKRLVMSQTYRQTSRVTAETWARDPENRLISRGPRFRLDAEVIRDQALFVSGLLHPQVGGKGVRPYQPENVWEPVGFSGSNTAKYVRESGDSLYRRSLYTFWKRTAPPPAMTTFDAPARESYCLRRERSNTPLQSLVLMNDVQHFEAARNFAQRILTEGGSGTEQRLSHGYRLAVGRYPSAQEASILRTALDEHLRRYQADPTSAQKAITFGDTKSNPTLNPSELAAWTLLANLILNLDETLNH